MKEWREGESSDKALTNVSQVIEREMERKVCQRREEWFGTIGFEEAAEARYFPSSPFPVKNVAAWSPPNQNCMRGESERVEV